MASAHSKHPQLGTAVVGGAALMTPAAVAGMWFGEPTAVAGLYGIGVGAVLALSGARRTIKRLATYT